MSEMVSTDETHSIKVEELDQWTWTPRDVPIVCLEPDCPNNRPSQTIKRVKWPSAVDLGLGKGLEHFCPFGRIGLSQQNRVFPFCISDSPTQDLRTLVKVSKCCWFDPTISRFSFLVLWCWFAHGQFEGSEAAELCGIQVEFCLAYPFQVCVSA
jgi:hypothetical protein